MDCYRCYYRQSFLALLVLTTTMSQLQMASSHPLADDKSSASNYAALAHLVHNHFGISKRATGELLKAAELAPNTCLPNPHFKELMDSLIQSEMARLQSCSKHGVITDETSNEKRRRASTK